MEVKIPKEIKSFTENVIGSFTLRQAISVAISMIIAVAIYVLLPLAQAIKVILGMVLILPVILFGFYEYNGMKTEQFLLLIVKHVFSNKKLKCRPQSFYEFILIERLDRKENKSAKFTKDNEADSKK